MPDLPLAGLVRVSSLGGREGERFHAAKDQVADLERYASAHGVGLEVLPPELDVSGGLALEDRPSLLAGIEGVERGDYSGIIVSYLSRLGRNVREQLRCWDRVEAAGGKVIVVREGIDTTTASGRLHRNLLLSIAEHEREVHAEQFARRRAASVERGIWRQRQTPRGYQRDPETRGLVADDKADEVRAAFGDRAREMPISVIARRLDMTPGGVRHMLRNRVYLGELRDGRNVNPAAHDPLISVADFEAAQINIPRPPRSRRSRALLAGLVRCASCGHVMTRAAAKERGDNYACSANHSGGRCPAPSSVTCKSLDPHVERLALTELAKLVTVIAEDPAPETAVRAAAAELEAYLSAVSAAVVGEEAFAAGAKGRQRALEVAQRAYRANLSKATLPAIGSGATAWANLNEDHRNTLLRSLLAAAVVAPAGRGRRIPIDERVLVVRFGADIDLPAGQGGRGGKGAGIIPIPFADVDPIDVLATPFVEDAL